MKLKSIASGSSGNCILAASDKTNILVDVGISKKRIEEGLKQADLCFKDIDGIFITHEHIDHVKGLGVISRSYDIPIYATEATLRQLSYMKKQLGEFDYSLFCPIDVDKRINIGDLELEAHSIWHDAVDPVCYSVFCEDRKLSIATDLGDFDEYIIEAIKDSDALLVEANHDIRMLQVGPYPYELKQRILGKRGHLSNEACGRLIKRVLNNHIKAILLGHLSDKNNYPELAYEAVKNELMGNAFTDDVREFNLTVAARETAGDLIYI